MKQWPRGESIETTLGRLAQVWRDMAHDTDEPLPFRIRDANEVLITQHENMLRIAVPAEVRALHQVVLGRTFSERDEGLPTVFLWPFEKTEWLDRETDMDIDYIRESHPAWFSADYLAFAQGNLR